MSARSRVVRDQGLTIADAAPNDQSATALGASPGYRWRVDAHAAFRTVSARQCVEHIDAARDGDRLAEGGFWVVVATFEGRLDAWRFEDVTWQRGAPRAPHGPTLGRPRATTRGSRRSPRREYVAGVERIRDDIRDGDVYQVNLCRVLSAPLPARAGRSRRRWRLSERLATGNPARYAARVVIPAEGGVPGTWVVSASPERYLSVDGDEVLSSPIKGTAAPGEAMLPKDEAENVMITDLIRNDLSQVAVPGSVTVPEFLALHEHPGLDAPAVHGESAPRAALRWTPAHVASAARRHLPAWLRVRGA